MKLVRMSLLAPTFALVALAGCKGDDATLTARAQGLVNMSVSPDSDVQVVVRDGHATLTGVASSDEVRRRAENAARSVEGIRSVEDEISLAPSLTSAPAPR